MFCRSWYLLSILFLYIIMRARGYFSTLLVDSLLSSTVVTRLATTRFIGQRPDTGVGAWNIESPPLFPLLSRGECPRRRCARGALLFLDFHISTFHHLAVANIPRDHPAISGGGSRELSSKRWQWKSKV